MKTQAVMYLSVLNCEKNTFRKKKYCNQSSPAALTTNDTEDLFKHAEKQIKGKFQEHVNATTTSTFVSNLAFISHSRVFFALGAWLKKSRKKNLEVTQKWKTKSHAKILFRISREILHDLLWAWHFIRVTFVAFEVLNS